MKLNEANTKADHPAFISGALQQFPAHGQNTCYLDFNAAELNPLDLGLQSAVAKMTKGISPIGLSLAFQDWLMHLTVSPGKQSDLISLLNRYAIEWGPVMVHAASAECPSSDEASDARFADSGWSNWPFNVFAKSFLQTQDFWQQATTGIRGVSPHHAQIVNFVARQLLDIFSPSNFPWTNPEVLRASVASKGQNYVSGWAYWLEDLNRLKAKSRNTESTDASDTPYKIARDVAITPGKVVYRNELVELIQYAPQTATVYREPILIVPSWIMKYYILDLSPHNSMVRYLVGQGHTVFMVSWRNPCANDRNLGMDDYLSMGVFDVLKEVARINGNVPVHATGYCLGGTLLAIAAAALERGRYESVVQLKTVTLLAALTDFSEPGELGLFIDDSELAFLDALMWEKGYLDGAQMADSFQLLNSRDLIWSHIMREYMLGIRTEPNDLMSWNVDTTRMPYRMHSEYLKHLFLHNDLAEGRYCVNGRPVVLTDIKAPMFVVGTERDHVSPWRSVYKISLLSDTKVDFVLASGGHNAGIVSEPGHSRRSYKFMPDQSVSAAYVSPDEWLEAASNVEGSWWPHWQQWLLAHSDAKRVKPLIMGAGVVLADAPGTYVRGA